MSALLALESALATVGFILSSMKLSSFELFPRSSASSSDISASEDTSASSSMKALALPTRFFLPEKDLLRFLIGIVEFSIVPFEFFLSPISQIGRAHV